MDLCPSVDKEAGEAYAKSIGARVFYTSAKSGMNVNELFTEMSMSIMRKRSATISFAAQNFDANGNGTVMVNMDQAPQEEKKKCCC